MTQNVNEAVHIIWDYMRCNDPVGDADCLLAIGSLRDDVATYAAELLSRHKYETVVLSGGNSRIVHTRALGWGDDTEAEHYLKLIRASGCKLQGILLEQEAAHTGENASKTSELLVRVGKQPKSVLVVTKPYMERRVKATFEIQWPSPRPLIRVTSPPLSFEEYCPSESDRHHTISIMIGDLQRIIEYPDLGLQAKQEIPRRVMRAFNTLVNEGYTKHLIS